MVDVVVGDIDECVTALADPRGKTSMISVMTKQAGHEFLHLIAQPFPSIRLRSPALNICLVVAAG